MPTDVSQTLGRDLSTVARHYNRWENEEESPVLAGVGTQGLRLGIWRFVFVTLEVFQCEKCVDFVDHTVRFLGGPLCETS